MFRKYSQDEAQALVKALKGGNQLAFSIVYKMYAAQTFSLAFKYLQNKELAEDAVQNLFLREFEIKSKNSKLSVIDKLYVNGGLLFKKAVCRDSRQGVGYKVTE